MKVTIKDIPSLDGDYTEPLTSLTNRELRTIKRISDVRAGEIVDGLIRGDNDLVIALAVIALARAGHDMTGAEDLLWDATAGCVKIDLSDEATDNDARPPDSPTVSGDENEPDGLVSPTERPASSGPVFAADGESPATDPKVSGVPV